MNRLPDLEEMKDSQGVDDVERFQNYLNHIYEIYIHSVAFGKLIFKDLPVRCKFMPETYGKHYAFWHMMQEGRIEDERNIDLERCKRIKWLSWVIQNYEKDDRIRVFTQNRGREKPWVLWLFESKYAIILWKRNGYFLLKTAFLVKPHKEKEFERDWKIYMSING